MLHRTLLKSGHSEVVSHAGGNVAHAKAAKKLIPGSASYYNRTDLGWVHGHKEMNYRKTYLGFKAYNKENMDYFAPFQNMWPYRHMETATPGKWFAAGTIAFNQMGYVPWPYIRQTAFWWGVPFPFFGFSYYFRYAKGGYIQKNKGAVFG